MKHNDSTIAERPAERPAGTVKHPLVAITLASGRIVFFSLRHPAKPMRVDYRTGDVWLDSA